MRMLKVSFGSLKQSADYNFHLEFLILPSSGRLKPTCDNICQIITSISGGLLKQTSLDLEWEPLFLNRVAVVSKQAFTLYIRTPSRSLYPARLRAGVIIKCHVIVPSQKNSLITETCPGDS